MPWVICHNVISSEPCAERTFPNSPLRAASEYLRGSKFWTPTVPCCYFYLVYSDYVGVDPRVYPLKPFPFWFRHLPLQEKPQTQQYRAHTRVRPYNLIKYIDHWNHHRSLTCPVIIAASTAAAPVKAPTATGGTSSGSNGGQGILWSNKSRGYPADHQWFPISIKMYKVTIEEM